jgi:hypothetical protein
MIEAWATAFGHHFQGRGSEVALYEMAIVEGVVRLGWHMGGISWQPGGCCHAARFSKQPFCMIRPLML